MRLGPISGVSLIVRDLCLALNFYVDGLRQIVVGRERLPKQRALDMGELALVDAPCAYLRCAQDAAPWLSLIEAPTAEPAAPGSRCGWSDLHLAVQDLAGLSAGRLDFADAAGAFPWGHSVPGQSVIGLDGERLHLWQIEAESAVLPARCAVDRPFAVSLATQKLAPSVGFYSGLGVLAQHECAPPPRALAAIYGPHFIDIVERPLLPAADSRLRAGLRMLSFARSNAHGRRMPAADDPSARILAGPDGEAIELV